jgi:hypothetical protein
MGMGGRGGDRPPAAGAPNGSGTGTGGSGGGKGRTANHNPRSPVQRPAAAAGVERAGKT